MDPRKRSGGTTDAGERQEPAKADLSRAVGSVREGAIALENLGQLLRSPRVGPRSLSRALPALQEAPQALASAFTALERAARTAADAGPEDEPAAVLSSASRVLDELGAELAELRGSIGARARLMLEARVRRARLACAPALELSAAIGHALEPRPAPLDLAELLPQRWPASVADERAPRGGALRIAVALADLGPLTADPVLLLALVEAMLRSVGEGGGNATLSVAPAARGTAVQAEAGASRAAVCLLPAGPTGARALQVARLLADVAGLPLEEGASGPTLRLP